MCTSHLLAIRHKRLKHNTRRNVFESRRAETYCVDNTVDLVPLGALPEYSVTPSLTRALRVMPTVVLDQS
jgi:hypothetical protein